MTWENILKRPMINMPDYDRHFEYDPEWLEETIKAWDKENPARVLHIEAPSTPDPSDRLEDTSIRFAASRSKKYLMDSFKFITDRPIDEQKGLYKVLENRGYKITNRDADYIRRMYGEKINGIFIPDEAKLYFISVGKERAKIQRERNPTKRSRQPDSRRNVADIEAWNKLHEEHNLDDLEEFVKYVKDIVKDLGLYNYRTYQGNRPTKMSIINDFKQKNKIEALDRSYDKYFSIDSNVLQRDIFDMLVKDLGQNKHRLYLAQKPILTKRWVNQNIVRPVYNLMLQQRIPKAKAALERQREWEKGEPARRAEREKRKRIQEAEFQRLREQDKKRLSEIQANKESQPNYIRGKQMRSTRRPAPKTADEPRERKRKTPNLQQNALLGRLQRQLEQAKRNGQTGRAANLRTQINDIKSKIGKMSWQDILKIYRLEEFI